MLFKTVGILLSFVSITSACDKNDYAHLRNLVYNKNTMRFCDNYKTEYKSLFPGVDNIVVIDRCFSRHDQEIQEPKSSANVKTLYIQVDGEGKAYEFSCNELPKQAVCGKYRGD